MGERDVARKEGGTIASIGAGLEMARPYFKSEERIAAWTLLVSVLLLTLILVGVAVLFTYWQRGLFNALEQKDWTTFLSLLLTWSSDAGGGLTIGFAPLLIIHVLATVYALYLQQRLQLRWRIWMTKRLTDAYLAGNTYYLLELRDEGLDNPDQRISEDINLYTAKMLELGFGLFRNVVSMLSFIVLLWGLSEDVSIFGAPVPGSLVWIAILYATAGTALTHFLGQRLIRLSFDQQRLEADFRFALIRVREFAEGIAFHGGEARENRRLGSTFRRVAGNFAEMINVTKRVTFSVTGLAQANLIFPLIIAAPAYFSGAIPLGGVFQTANALNKVVENLSWIVDNYVVLAAFAATVDRLSGFERSVASVGKYPRGVTRMAEESPVAIRCEALSIFRPDGEVLLDKADLVVNEGEWVLVSGRSGSGKTMLLKTIATLWPHAQGRVSLASNAVMFVPQKPYVPVGCLRDALVYPDFSLEVTEAEIEKVLELTGLTDLLSASSKETDWLQILSGGEVQRLSFARILLHRPRVIVLDEATSQLDTEFEEAAYAAIKLSLPDATVISVAHRQTVAKFHERTLWLKDRKLLDAQPVA
ncbi:ABC transporter-like protein [Hyphomonas polymorpha PS728]|uniref:ABC transporter-like protein n=1 Tax=Hyphomonas polymorpha PS728 TaxID=1280954 RepID=A0A062VH30_9PROT|nr:ABC transporter ATP-binding protein/permease [Hyphomonas polymorpha]KCZ97320.1 ABC transporter-like protein [Hyphomonas polymorpha PS728]